VTKTKLLLFSKFGDFKKKSEFHEGLETSAHTHTPPPPPPKKKIEEREGFKWGKRKVGWGGGEPISFLIPAYPPAAATWLLLGHWTIPNAFGRLRIGHVSPVSPLSLSLPNASR